MRPSTSVDVHNDMFPPENGFYLPDVVHQHNYRFPQKVFDINSRCMSVQRQIFLRKYLTVPGNNIPVQGLQRQKICSAKECPTRKANQCQAIQTASSPLVVSKYTTQLVWGTTTILPGSCVDFFFFFNRTRFTNFI